jgi:chorismate synthase
LEKEIDTMINLRAQKSASSIFCPDVHCEKEMMRVIESARDAGDSLGGVVAFYSSKLPVGLGDPVYEKLEANLACALLSIPASKAFEIGEGFHAATLSGSAHNDVFVENQEQVMATNHAGGTLGGISNGMPLVGRVAFKPTSSIKKPQATVDHEGRAAIFQLPEGSRHDPCIAIRAVPVVEAMCALVLVDAILMSRTIKL